MEVSASFSSQMSLNLQHIKENNNNNNTNYFFFSKTPEDIPSPGEMFFEVFEILTPDLCAVTCITSAFDVRESN